MGPRSALVGKGSRKERAAPTGAARPQSLLGILSVPAAHRPRTRMSLLHMEEAKRGKQDVRCHGPQRRSQAAEPSGQDHSTVDSEARLGGCTAFTVRVCCQAGQHHQLLVPRNKTLQNR
ncbi:hypothetical protein CB1_000243032 [Camelus ferus]|nr:hypothetical protein CB1_000243032 [Camelus ferus]